MEMVEVVIRIPKELYMHTQEHEVGGFNQENDIKIFNAIKNAVVLPKGHGELKDVSNLLTVTDYDGETEKTYVLYDEIKHAHTVIEADKEGE